MASVFESLNVERIQPTRESRTSTGVNFNDYMTTGKVARALMIADDTNATPGAGSVNRWADNGYFGDDLRKKGRTRFVRKERVQAMQQDWRLLTDTCVYTSNEAARLIGHGTTTMVNEAVKTDPKFDTDDTEIFGYKLPPARTGGNGHRRIPAQELWMHLAAHRDAHVKMVRVTENLPDDLDPEERPEDLSEHNGVILWATSVEELQICLEHWMRWIVRIVLDPDFYTDQDVVSLHKKMFKLYHQQTFPMGLRGKSQKCIPVPNIPSNAHVCRMDKESLEEQVGRYG